MITGNLHLLNLQYISPDFRPNLESWREGLGPLDWEILLELHLVTAFGVVPADFFFFNFSPTA